MFQGLGVNNCPAASCRTCSAKPRPVPSQGPMGCRVRAGPTGSRRIPRQTQCWRSSVLPKPKLHRPLLRAKTASFQVGSWQVMMKSLDEGSLRLIFLRWHRVAFKADRFLCVLCASLPHGQERRQKQIVLFRQESEAVGIISCQISKQIATPFHLSLVQPVLEVACRPGWRHGGVNRTRPN